MLHLHLSVTLLGEYTARKKMRIRGNNLILVIPVTPIGIFITKMNRLIKLSFNLFSTKSSGNHAYTAFPGIA